MTAKKLLWSGHLVLALFLFLAGSAAGQYRPVRVASPYPSLKGLEAVRESLAESAPALKNADLKKFIDDRFVKPK